MSWIDVIHNQYWTEATISLYMLSDEYMWSYVSTSLKNNQAIKFNNLLKIITGFKDSQDVSIN